MRILAVLSLLVCSFLQAAPIEIPTPVEVYGGGYYYHSTIDASGGVWLYLSGSNGVDYVALSGSQIRSGGRPGQGAEGSYWGEFVGSESYPTRGQINDVVSSYVILSLNEDYRGNGTLMLLGQEGEILAVAAIRGFAHTVTFSEWYDYGTAYAYYGEFEINQTPAPEPSTVALLAGALLGVGVYKRRYPVK